MNAQDSTQMVRATCLCGLAKHNITLKSSQFPIKGHLCHCDSCRSVTGALCLTVVLPTDYAPDASVLNKLTSYAFSERVSFYFCPTCGCQMLLRCTKDADDPHSKIFWGVATGTLERIEDVVEWRGHEYVQDTLDGGFADLLPSIQGKALDRWPAYFGEGVPLPLPWSSPSRTKIEATDSDKLHGKCKCGGVEFWLARPSPRSAFAKKFYPNHPPDDVSGLHAEESETFYLRDNGTKYLVGLCACNSCRLACGTEITTWAFVPAFQISLSKEAHEPWTRDFGTLKQYESSPGCWRYFCGRCGAIVFYDAKGREYFKDVAVGLLRAIEGARAESWFGWRTSRLGYRDDAIPRAESFALSVEKGLRDWEAKRDGADLSGHSQSGGAL